MGANLPWQGLLLPPMTWASETALSAGTEHLVAASDYYDADDYIRDFDDSLILHLLVQIMTSVSFFKQVY